MRRHHLVWSIAVFGIVFTAYGAHLMIYHGSRGEGLYVPGLLLLILGVAVLALFLGLYIYFSLTRKKANPTFSEEVPTEKEPEEAAEEAKPEPEPAPVEEPKEEKKEEAKPAPKRKEETTYESRPSRSYESSYSRSYSTVYVKKVGYGPVLRVEGPRILDMRTGTYYRIENNAVMQEGYGIRYEIRGNQIRDAFGPYLYELSGSNINKVFGGFYASISGNYITLYDLSDKYEMTDSLSKKQILAAAALLFGRY